MDKKYIELFKELTRATAVIAEQVMDYDADQGDQKALETATTMRDDFQALYDKISAEDFDGKFEQNEYAKLLVATYIVANNLRDRMVALKASIDGYTTDIIPKLQTMVDAKPEDNLEELANKTFVLESNK